MNRLCGFVWCNGTRNFQCLETDALSRADARKIEEILSKYDTAGSSVADCYEDRLSDVFRPEYADYSGEDMTSSHSEKDIYDGCLSLMEGLVADFEEYLEFIGVDTSEYPDEEKFGVSYSPMEIVERLFLLKTYHSGGTSQMLKCRELGIDPSERIRFTFSEEEEE